MSALNSWMEEKQSAYLYRIVANKETNPKYQQMFLSLADAAEKQALLWAEKIQQSGSSVPEYHPSIRTRIVASLVNYFGVRQMRTILAAMKVRGLSVYLSAGNEHRHRSIKNGNNLRAAVFGMSDGLVSNASLILGMLGAMANQQIVTLAGVAGLLAGAFSMGAGEYISVRTQREMYEYQIGLEKEELELYPEEERDELAVIYQARGLSLEEAQKMADTIMQDPVNALNVLAREELGLDPDSLVSPWGAAISSFFAFSLGALIPLIPFFFSDNQANLTFSVVLTACFLFGIGTILGLYTGRQALFSGLRMLFIGSIAGSVTYLIGKLLGVIFG